MIEVFKILTGLYDAQLSPSLVMSDYVRTRGNSRKLKMRRSKGMILGSIHS